MWNKPLIWREIRQARGIIWILPILHFLMLGMSRMNAWFMGEPYWIEQKTSQVRTMLDAYDYGQYESSSRIILAIIVFILALIQLGSERRNGVQEQLFSMPYSRRQIFISKWLVGVGLLLGSILLNTIIDMIVMANSPVSEFFNLTYHLNQGLYTLLAVTAIYSVALFIGSISGSIASQAVFSFIFFVLPIGLWVLVDDFMRLHNIVDRNEFYYTMSGKIEEIFFTGNYLSLSYDMISLTDIIVMGLLLLVTAWGGIMAYERSRLESNGKLLIFGFWETVLEIGFVICFALLCASFISSAFGFSRQLVVYYVGVLIGVALGTFIIRKLTRVRLKI